MMMWYDDGNKMSCFALVQIFFFFFAYREIWLSEDTIEIDKGTSKGRWVELWRPVQV